MVVTKSNKACTVSLFHKHTNVCSVTKTITKFWSDCTKPPCNLWGKSAATKGGRSSLSPLSPLHLSGLSTLYLSQKIWPFHKLRQKQQHRLPSLSRWGERTSCLHRSKSAITLDNICFFLSDEVDYLSSAKRLWQTHEIMCIPTNPTKYFTLLITKNWTLSCLWWNTCACTAPSLIPSPALPPLEKNLSKLSWFTFVQLREREGQRERLPPSICHPNHALMGWYERCPT